MSNGVPYFITSNYNNEPVGLPEIVPIGSVPVVLKGVVRDWVASRSIVEGGPVFLGLKNFPYTFELNGNVQASTSPEQSREWYTRLVEPGNVDLHYISTDREFRFVWTAEYSGGPVRIEPLSEGRPEQIFKITPRLLE